MKRYKRILVTSALPYANGPIHLGHLAGAYLPADVYVRYQRMQKRDVIYICGSDEHGVPITIAAEKQGVSPQNIVDEYHQRNLDAFDRFGMSFDYYGRTSSLVHHKTSQDFFKQLDQKGIFNKKTEKQLYDKTIKMFLPDRYVKGTCPVCSYTEAYGDQCEKCGSSLSVADLKNPKSVLTGQEPELKETEHWFLPLGELQHKIENWLKDKKNWKPNVIGQVRSWLDAGLSDRAVTRDLNWGVPVPHPDAKGKVLYVWFDAPIGYISATKEWAAEKGKPELWKTYWQDEETQLVHFIGKDNIVFHCIMFPAMLMTYGKFILPDNVPANEFLNLEGDKLSTSRNYAVWLEDYLEKFDPDLLRYYLTINAPETKDSDFTWKEFQQRNNGELADILGNFINRTLTFARKRFDNKVPAKGELNQTDQAMIDELRKAPTLLGTSIEHFELRKAASALMNVARMANKYFNDKEPWKTVKEDPEQCATTLHICLQAVQSLAILMEPILPFSAQNVWQMLGHKDDIHDHAWEEASELALPVGQTFGEIDILFRKIEDEKIEPEILRLQKSKPMSTEEEKPETERVTIEDLAKIQLKVATVLQAEKIEKADKLLKLQIQIGDETRQLVAGIAKHYVPQELVGKKIIVVANLQPAKIRGIESNGMLLAAEDEQGAFSLLTVDRDVDTHASIR
ncbi:methionine--tRNA ligase [candidate division KSB1 bacterium]|nr:methionine--tRNA ligase [candidate division KSB1 bacterium]